jgi:murein L,D-transpeptidase YafK
MVISPPEAGREMALVTKRMWIMAAAAALAVAWGSSAVARPADGLAPANSAVSLQVWKGQRRMEFRRGRELIRTFRIALGTQPQQTKEIRGDGRTPVGQYYVCDKNERSQFHRFLGLSYPNITDAERGYDTRLIDATQWADIFFANLRGGVPPWSTPLGGRVGIHGFGGRPFVPVDWTEGCIAVSDEDIDYLFDRVSVGTPVFIHE